MKIALAQLNYHIANFESNGDKIKSAIKKAKDQQVDLIIFSELAICGYPPHDLLEQKDFINRCEKQISEIAKECEGIAAIIGGPRTNPNPKGKLLYNSAYFLAYGKIQSCHDKTLLPTYDVFDEYRYFEPNTEFNVAYYQGKRIGITICEDLWYKQPVDDSFSRQILYSVSPMREIMKQHPDFVVNISGSPFNYTHHNARLEVVIDNARAYNVPVFYVNQVGANTDLIFDGGSLVVDQFGEIFEQLKTFEEDYFVCNLNEVMQYNQSSHKKSFIEKTVIEKIHDGLILGIRDYFGKSDFKTATLGLSGGIDSAVVLALAVKALGNQQVRVLLLPSKFSSDHSVNDAKTLSENLSVRYDIINIQSVVDSFETSLQPIFNNLPSGIAEENIQARARGVLLMGLSNKFGNILLNTSNKSEAAVGYGTLYGDMMGSISVLGDVYKTYVYKLAHFINKDKEIIPMNTIVKPPSAELRSDQKDTDSLPDYDILDHILYQYIELKKGEREIIEQGYDKTLVKRILRMVNMNEFKRFQTPPILRISIKAFGVGRRMPLVAKY
jgi:NAD+ synthase (glutamine-hydrolysing)